MSLSISEAALETLAASIGEVAYIDVAKWHLYLNDAKLHKLVAQRLYPMIEGDRISEADISQALQEISIPIAAGRKQIPLADLVPTVCLGDIAEALEAFKAQL